MNLKSPAIKFATAETELKFLASYAKNLLFNGNGLRWSICQTLMSFKDNLRSRETTYTEKLNGVLTDLLRVIKRPVEERLRSIRSLEAAVNEIEEQMGKTISLSEFSPEERKKMVREAYRFEASSPKED